MTLFIEQQTVDGNIFIIKFFTFIHCWHQNTVVFVVIFGEFTVLKFVKSGSTSCKYVVFIFRIDGQTVDVCIRIASCFLDIILIDVPLTIVKNLDNTWM